MLNIYDRMKKAANVSNDTELANVLNLSSPSVVAQWKKRNKKPYKECEIISQEYNVDLTWLLTGKESTLPFTTLNTEITPEAYKRYASKILKDIIYINDYKDVALSAGGGAYADDHALSIGKRAFNLSWLLKKGLNPKNLSLVRVMGDSMEPLLKDKDMAMIDTSRTHPNDKMPFACIWEDELYIKLIQPKQPKIIKLVSVNKSYETMEVDLSWQNFKIIGAIVWHSHSWI